MVRTLLFAVQNANAVSLSSSDILDKVKTRNPMRPQATLHFFCGKMASGKSTLARQLAKSEDAILISEDEWLSKLYPDEISVFSDYRKYSSRIKLILRKHVQDILARGISVILDFPGNTRTQRAWFRSIFEKQQFNHVLHFIDISDDRCKEQLRKRSQDKPEGSAFTTEAEFEAITSHFRAPDIDEGFHIEVHEEE